MSEDTSNHYKEANLLAGDSIMNYRTVASFANEQQILEDYKGLLKGPLDKISKDAHILGGIFGFS